MSHSYDLRPLPRNREMIEHLSPRISQVQETLGQRILLENVADASSHAAGQMPEWEFIGKVAENSDSLILLDLNNIVSNGVQVGFDPVEYVRHLPAERIWQIHLAPLVLRVEYEWDADTRTSAMIPSGNSIERSFRSAVQWPPCSNAMTTFHP